MMRRNRKMRNFLLLTALVFTTLLTLAACQPGTGQTTPEITDEAASVSETLSVETEAVIIGTEETVPAETETAPDLSVGTDGVVFSTTGALTRLTDTPGDEYHAAWSPDSRWLLFVYWEGNAYSLGVYDFEENTRTILNAEVNGDLYLDWAPDGSAFVFDGFQPGDPSSIYLVEFPDDLSTPLEPQQLDVPTPAFMTSMSPDSEQVLFFHDNQIKTFDLETQTTTVVPNSEGCWHPQFSPDGSSILFTKEADGIVDIYSMALDGTGLTKLTDSSRNFDRGKWSPDGSRIVYVAEEDGETEIWLTELATGETLRLVAFPGETGGYLSMPEFSPDGDAIVLSYDGDLWLAEGLADLEWE